MILGAPPLKPPVVKFRESPGFQMDSSHWWRLKIHKSICGPPGRTQVGPIPRFFWRKHTPQIPQCLGCDQRRDRRKGIRESETGRSRLPGDRQGVTTPESFRGKSVGTFPPNKKIGGCYEGNPDFTIQIFQIWAFLVGKKVKPILSSVVRKTFFLNNRTMRTCLQENLWNILQYIYIIWLDVFGSNRDSENTCSNSIWWVFFWQQYAGSSVDYCMEAAHQL